MAEILVRCPRSQQPVPTGLKAEWVVLNSLPSLAIPFVCAACGQMHTWKREDAWIAGDSRMQGAGAEPAHFKTWNGAGIRPFDLAR